MTDYLNNPTNMINTPCVFVWITTLLLTSRRKENNNLWNKIRCTITAGKKCLSDMCYHVHVLSAVMVSIMFRKQCPPKLLSHAALNNSTKAMGNILLRYTVASLNWKHSVLYCHAFDLCVMILFVSFVAL